MSGDGGVVAVLRGGRPWGRPAQERIPLREGDVRRVGRLDTHWLNRSPVRESHVALGPAARPSVPVLGIVLAVSRSAVEVAFGSRLFSVLVDGSPLGREPVRLAGPSHTLVIDPSGAPHRLHLVFAGSGPGGAAAVRPDPPSGTTIVPQLRFAGRGRLAMAAALAWPLVPGMPVPLSEGWSTAAAAARFEELFGLAPRNPRRALYDLRTMLAEADSADGRPLRLIPELQPWPWPNDWRAAAQLSEEAFTADCNRITALYLADCPQVRREVGEAVDRAHPPDRRR